MISFKPLTPEFFSATVTGTVVQEISPQCPGRVKYCASYWKAKFFNVNHNAKLKPNEEVEIVGRIGNTLLVEPRQ